MASIDRKSIADFGLSIGGVNLSEGGGEGEFFSLVPAEVGGSKTGVHGDAVLYDLYGSVHVATITLLETSENNRQLQDLYNAQVDRTTTGTLDFSAEDVGTDETFSGQAIFVKAPDRVKTPEAVNYQWTMHVASTTGWTYSERSEIAL